MELHVNQKDCMGAYTYLCIVALGNYHMQHTEITPVGLGSGVVCTWKHVSMNNVLQFLQELYEGEFTQSYARRNTGMMIGAQREGVAPSIELDPHTIHIGYTNIRMVLRTHNPVLKYPFDKIGKTIPTDYYISYISGLKLMKSFCREINVESPHTSINEYHLRALYKRRALKVGSTLHENIEKEFINKRLSETETKVMSHVFNKEKEKNG